MRASTMPRRQANVIVLTSAPRQELTAAAETARALASKREQAAMAQMVQAPNTQQPVAAASMPKQGQVAADATVRVSMTQQQQAVDGEAVTCHAAGDSVGASSRGARAGIRDAAGISATSSCQESP